MRVFHKWLFKILFFKDNILQAYLKLYQVSSTVNLGGQHGNKVEGEEEEMEAEEEEYDTGQEEQEKVEEENQEEQEEQKELKEQKEQEEQGEQEQEEEDLVIEDLEWTTLILHMLKFKLKLEK